MHLSYDLHRDLARSLDGPGRYGYRALETVSACACVHVCVHVCVRVSEFSVCEFVCVCVCESTAASSKRRARMIEVGGWRWALQ